MPNTKIVATLGPATDQPGVLQRLLEAGANVLRLNASHGDQQKHRERIEMVRAAAAAHGTQPAILLDLQGPKIRLGRFEGGKCLLEAGSEFTITTKPELGNARKASTGYDAFARDVKPGDRVLLADGALELRVKTSDGVEACCEVISGGMIGDNKGINLPNVKVSIPSLTEKDLADLEFGISAGVDMVALSFVRSGADVEDLRRRLEARKCAIPIVAKIEKPKAVDDLEAVLDATDGVMVARGDLGVEMALEMVPVIQKTLIRRARRKGKFVITATQMLESMIQNSTPTRAEVSDVANAIFDGTDAVMLSAETSVGQYPVEAVSYMRRVAVEAERFQPASDAPSPLNSRTGNYADIVASSAFHAARDSDAKAIVVFTTSGSSARQVSRYRPSVPVYAITPSIEAARRLAVYYGVKPILAQHVDDTDEMVMLMDQLVKNAKLLQVGDTVVFVAGQPIGRPGTTNMMKLHRVGELSDDGY